MCTSGSRDRRPCRCSGCSFAAGGRARATAAAAYAYGFGALPVPLRLGGTIPAIALFQEMLGVDTVLMGFALPTDGAHAPNEKFHLPTFYRGIRTAARFLDEVASRTARLAGPAQGGIVGDQVIN
jgi:Peptidase family M20/M25/M40